ncbi:class I SAM-dependent methyltransferase [Amycolatopsis sp. K13G38]|uniref:S-adenosyl-L-methionine-dependent methyltransferase n=1 Tax=Amycolatopsis acididurans TaxID=2724524 RepID=A0ABX1J488_9PSEU|nr:class I SAM-dependent methyltransferase [Amycolatopsis acididurans]NKQ54612.1 class I SAM-dependent methyltransferase [Amycolatopsis acididurans]
MNSGPSSTALTAAAARAAHALVDAEPHIFTDPLAVTVLGDRAEELLAYHKVSGAHPVLRGARTQVVVRSHYTERRLAQAGAGQYVVLGAGLDTFAYRSHLSVRVFEVDHPATQAWKRACLDAAGISAAVCYVAVDLETGSLLDALRRTGFDPKAPTFVSWLGVTMYLSADALANNLSALAQLAEDTQLVADYMVPPQLRDEAGNAYADAVAPIAAQGGEPWLSSFTPEDMAGLLARHGFGVLEDVGQHHAIDNTLWRRTDGLAPSTLSRLVHATLTSTPR